MAGWQTKSSKVVYQNPWITVHEDQVVTPTGNDGIYGWIESTDTSVYIVAIDDENKIQIIQQYRYALKDTYWEIPAGRVPGDEDLTDGACRELEEETGFRAGNIAYIGTFLDATGTTTFTSKVFLARQLTKVSDSLDQEDGVLQTKAVSRQEFDTMVLNGDMQCAGSITAVSLARIYLERGRNDRISVWERT